MPRIYKYLRRTFGYVLAWGWLIVWAIIGLEMLDQIISMPDKDMAQRLFPIVLFIWIAVLFLAREGLKKLLISSRKTER